MTQPISIDQLHTYIAETVNEIKAVRQELEQIQIGFNSAFVEWKAEHDAALERLTEEIVDQFAAVGSVLQEKVAGRLVEERRVIAARMEELDQTLIPESRQVADELLHEGQALVKALRQLNPELNQHEEGLKSRQAVLEAELDQRNQKVRELSRGLGVIIHFLALVREDRKRQQVIGALRALHQELKAVRETWSTTSMEASEKRAALQAEWREKTLHLAELQGELEFLLDEKQREALARKRAIRYEIDHLNTPIDCPVPALKAALDNMVEVNQQTDAYHDAFNPMGGMIGLLDGILEGMQRLNQSVKGLMEEQRMHGAYLPKLKIFLPPDVLDFHDQWPDMQAQVRDEAALTAEPAAFQALVEPWLEQDLGEKRIQAMFEGFGHALEQATQKWSG